MFAHVRVRGSYCANFANFSRLHVGIRETTVGSIVSKLFRETVSLDKTVMRVDIL